MVDQYKYLGVVLIQPKHGLIFKEMWPYISEKASKASFAVTKKYAYVGHLTPILALKLFDTFVLPIVNYASELWRRESEIKVIEAVQLKYLKCVLGVKNGTSTVALLGETGRFPILFHQHIRLIKYWIRLVQMKSNTIAKKAFICNLTLSNAGYDTWLSKVFKVQLR